MPPEEETPFGIFDPSQEVDKSHRSLPHWFQPGVATFITFRTEDSMPREVIIRWRRELEDWLTRNGLSAASVDTNRLEGLPDPQQKEFLRLRARLWQDSLDGCHGACLLRDPALAQIVGEALHHFNGERFDLDSFVVMPNHVHVLVQFLDGVTLSQQTDSWLRYSASQINQRLNRKGKFWQSEPFDHLVRSAEQFAYLQGYIRDNPIKARLRQGEYLYWTRTAE